MGFDELISTLAAAAEPLLIDIHCHHPSDAAISVQSLDSYEWLGVGKLFSARPYPNPSTDTFHPVHNYRRSREGGSQTALLDSRLRGNDESREVNGQANTNAALTITNKACGLSGGPDEPLEHETVRPPTGSERTVSGDQGNRYFSLGLHPWFIDQQDVAAALALIEQQAPNPKLLAIGECGLDKCIETSPERQIAVFTQQLAIAERYHKPLIIHCVRAFNELMRVKKQCPNSPPWIIHGFNNNWQIARQLLAQDCYLSLGKALLKPDSPASQILPDIPLDRLFLETDAAHDIGIKQIYAAAARILHLDIGVLSAELHRNFTRVFLHD